MSDTTLSELESWLVERDYRGWDPFDALNSPWLKRLSCGWYPVQRVVVQLLKRAPLNMRPLLRVPQLHNAKAMGLLLTGHARRFAASGTDHDRERIDHFSAWLERNAQRDTTGAAWGYPFDWPNRSGFFPAGTPTVVTTAFIGLGLVEAYRVTGEDRLLALAAESAQFVHSGLNCRRDTNGVCASYTPLDQARVHNANLLGAALLLEVGTLRDEARFVDAGRERVGWSMAQQAEDGSWLYGADPGQDWIDSFHTGYNLEALDRAARLTADPVCADALTRGYRYYLDRFFLADGTVKYYHDRAYPLDAHAFAHALITLTRLQRLNERSLPLRTLVRRQLETRFRSGQGFFYYQQQPRYTNRIPYTRWVQAWIWLALVTMEEGG